jgi:hypothetical protein
MKVKRSGGRKERAWPYLSRALAEVLALTDVVPENQVKATLAALLFLDFDIYTKTLTTFPQSRLADEASEVSRIYKLSTKCQNMQYQKSKLADHPIIHEC